MKSFGITDKSRLKIILRTFSQLDEIRWNTSSNYNLINYCRDDLTADEKLLTHWLSYIMDRQMPFQRIWDIGGYVVSHLVRAFTATPEESVRDIVERYIKKGQSIALECPRVQSSDRLARYGSNARYVQFASRYMPEDAVLIYRTLGILDRISGRSLAGFVGKIIECKDDHAKAIRKLAAALDAMTYSAAGAVRISEFSARMRQETMRIAKFQLDSKYDKELFGRKRLWCSLRDYLKSPEFNDVFTASLSEAGVENAKKWHRSDTRLRAALQALELPGDTWNNADVFRNGLFRPYLENERKSWDMPRTIRAIHEELSETAEASFYPEQIDVSFDFVPRMCQRDMCDVCLFGEGIRKTCHQQKGILCPVALYSCGYRHICQPTNCELKHDDSRGSCRNHGETRWAGP